MAAVTWWTPTTDDDEPIVYEMTAQGWTATRQTSKGPVVVARGITLREVYAALGADVRGVDELEATRDL